MQGVEDMVVWVMLPEGTIKKDLKVKYLFSFTSAFKRGCHESFSFDHLFLSSNIGRPFQRQLLSILLFMSNNHL